MDGPLSMEVIIMWIDNVVHISVDEEYYYIEVGVTLNCITITVSRDMVLKVIKSPYDDKEMAVSLTIE